MNTIHTMNIQILIQHSKQKRLGTPGLIQKIYKLITFKNVFQWKMSFFKKYNTIYTTCTGEKKKREKRKYYYIYICYTHNTECMTHSCGKLKQFAVIMPPVKLRCQLGGKIKTSQQIKLNRTDFNQLNAMECSLRIQQVNTTF